MLAGGAARRLGGERPGDVKPGLVVAGLPLVDHALAAVAGARRRVLVAPPELARPGVATTLEDPPLGGPVAGLAAGLALLTEPGDDSGRDPRRERGDEPGDGRAAVVVVLACDVPRAGEVVDALVAAACRPGVDGARLVDDEGAPQHLVAAYRRDALDSAVAALGPGTHGASVRRLVADLTLVDVPDPGGASADADTWPSVRALSAALTARRATPSDTGSSAARSSDARSSDTAGRAAETPAGGTIEAEHADHAADHGRSPS
ncbi:NTP transferase domain-containing protein [Cellulomonas palmilytica]|nr:NTP transferase domain-containing protein [Cellulomonas palmilytica]